MNKARIVLTMRAFAFILSLVSRERHGLLCVSRIPWSGSEHTKSNILDAETDTERCYPSRRDRKRLCFFSANRVGGKEEKMAEKSFIAKPAEIERKWYVVDADGKNLGRMASQIAAVLRGKNKPIYTPHVDCGDYVIVINAEKVAVTGKKRKEKIYKRHSGYPGGLKETTFEEMMKKHPTEAVRHAVKGMMPKGRLGRQMYKKLKVYAGPEHEHAAQKPEVLDI